MLIGGLCNLRLNLVESNSQCGAGQVHLRRLLSEAGARLRGCECKYKDERAEELHGRNCEPIGRLAPCDAGPRIAIQTLSIAPIRQRGFDRIP